MASARTVGGELCTQAPAEAKAARGTEAGAGECRAAEVCGQELASDCAGQAQTQETEVGALEQATAGIASGEPPLDGLWTLLETCADNTLLHALPTLLGALPQDARARCLAAVREALGKEASSTLMGDTAGEAIWRRVLALPPQTTATPDRVKRPLHAMAMPFVAARAPKRLKDAVGGPAQAPPAEDDTPVTSAGGVDATTSVLVSNIPYEVSDVYLRTFFRDKCVGARLVDVRILRTPAGKSKGAAILTFDTHQGVEKAIDLNGVVFEDRLLAVREHRGAPPRMQRKANTPGDAEAETRSVIVKNLCWSANEAQLHGLLASCGEVSAVRVARDRRTGRSKGFAVVEFSHKAAVPRALGQSGRDVRGRAVRIEALVGTQEAQGTKHEAGARELVRGEQASDRPSSPSAGERFATFVDDLDAANVEPVPQDASISVAGSSRLAGDQAEDAVREHARKLVSRAQETAADDATGRELQRPGDLTTLYPGGQEGLQAAAALAAAHDCPQALLAAVGPDALKARLTAIGLKGSGPPLQRAERLLRLNGLCSLDEVPKELLAKRHAESPGAATSRGPVKFVRAGEEGVPPRAGGENLPVVETAT